MSNEITPVVKLQMLFRVLVERVFETFVDPKITTRFWFTHRSGDGSHFSAAGISGDGDIAFVHFGERERVSG